MSLVDKIRKILDEKVAEKETVLIDEVTLDEKGNPFAKKDDSKSDDKEDDKSDDEDDDESDDEDDGEKDDKMDKKKDKVDVKESLAKIFAKANISEDLFTDLETLFNAAVTEKISEKSEEYEAYQTEEIAKLVEEFEGRVDKYLSYVAEEWLKENEVEIETGIKVEIAENLVTSMKTIFEDSYVEIPESKVDLVKEAEETIDSLLSTIDEGKEKYDALQLELNGIKSKKIVDELSSEMTETQKEKLGTLVDSIEFTDESNYKDKVSVIIENYFNTKVDEKLDEKQDEKVDDKSKSAKPTDRMAAYVSHLRKKD